MDITYFELLLIWFLHTNIFYFNTIDAWVTHLFLLYFLVRLGYMTISKRVWSSLYIWKELCSAFTVQTGGRALCSVRYVLRHLFLLPFVHYVHNKTLSVLNYGIDFFHTVVGFMTCLGNHRQKKRDLNAMNNKEYRPTTGNNLLHLFLFIRWVS